MIDMQIGRESWLLPDGSAAFASSPGTTGSKGVIEPYSEPASAPDAVRVSFGADFIFCSRDHSGPMVERALESVARKWRVPGAEALKVIDKGFGAYVEGADLIRVSDAEGGVYLSDLIHRDLTDRAS